MVLDTEVLCYAGHFLWPIFCLNSEVSVFSLRGKKYCSFIGEKWLRERLQVKTRTALFRCDTTCGCLRENSGLCNVLRRDLKIFNGVFQIALSSPWTLEHNTCRTCTQETHREGEAFCLLCSLSWISYNPVQVMSFRWEILWNHFF